MLKKAYSRYIKDKISASKFPEVFLNGKKLSRTECKEHTMELVEGHPLTPEQLDKAFKKAGLGGSQVKTSKRKGIIATIFGQGKKNPTKKELQLIEEHKRRMVAGSRYTAERAFAESDIGQLGGMAGRLKNRDGRSKVDNILATEANDSKGGKMKIGAGALGIQGRNYNVTANAGGRSISSTNKSGFANTPSQATGLTGDHGAGHIPQSGTHNPLR